jgi:hypothetical protein
MAKFFEAVIGSLVFMALIAAGVWFGGPMIWQHLADSEAARKTVAVQQTALSADAGAASRAQSSCAAEVAASVRAGAAIARVSRPVTPTAAEQPMLTSKDISDALQ